MFLSLLLWLDLLLNLQATFLCKPLDKSHDLRVASWATKTKVIEGSNESFPLNFPLDVNITLSDLNHLPASEST